MRRAEPIVAPNLPPPDVTRDAVIQGRRRPSSRSAFPMSRRRTMAIPHATPGQGVDVRPLGDRVKDSITTTLVKTDDLEVIRLVVPSGKEIPEHKARGAITVHCLEGAVEFRSHGQSRQLPAGHLLYLEAGEAHAVKGVEDSSLLLTLSLGKKG
jgi:quercetin dioxygenase-like cupin family protein